MKRKQHYGKTLSPFSGAFFFVFSIDKGTFGAYHKGYVMKLF
jgi:hypothetical protein